MTRKTANSGGAGTSNPNEVLFSRAQTANRFGVCIETIKRMEKRGLLQAVRFNRRNIRYRLSDIERLEGEAMG
jgi:predicted site-specific integrase-resolvase